MASATDIEVRRPQAKDRKAARELSALHAAHLQAACAAARASSQGDAAAADAAKKAPPTHTALSDWCSSFA